MHRSEKPIQPHELDKVDHLVPSLGKKVAGLPDAHRESWIHDDTYPDNMNPYPKFARGKPHNERVEPNFRGKKQ